MDRLSAILGGFCMMAMKSIFFNRLAADKSAAEMIDEFPSLMSKEISDVL
jgi:hypothetical protein